MTGTWLARLIVLLLPAVALAQVVTEEGSDAEAPVAATPAEKPAAAPQSAAPDGIERAREWMIAQRIAREGLNPKQALALEADYAKLTPPQLRVLLMVYEKTYGVAYPYAQPDAANEDPLQATREWLVAYRIVRDKLTVEQAKAFGEQVRKMSPSQVRIMEMAYEEQMQLDRDRPSRRSGDAVAQAPTTNPSQNPTPDPSRNPPPQRTPTQDEESQLRLREAQERRMFEQQKGSMSLQQAGRVRGQSEYAMNTLNSTANSAANMSIRRFDYQTRYADQNIQQQQYLNDWRGNVHSFWGW